MSAGVRCVARHRHLLPRLEKPRSRIEGTVWVPVPPLMGPLFPLKYSRLFPQKRPDAAAVADETREMEPDGVTRSGALQTPKKKKAVMKQEVTAMLFCRYKMVPWAKNSIPGDSSKTISPKTLLCVTSP